MKCNQCHCTDTRVIESRDVADGEAIRRRRACDKCHHRFTTYERLERPQLVVVKTDGTRELFSRDKLVGGLYRACEKTPVTSVQLERLVADVERALHTGSDQEVSSSRVGELVMQRLAGLNEVAYVRFASVYRRFTDITGFERELAQIRDLKHEGVQADTADVKVKEA
ncbi:transcriptional regulator NrdR [Candidatus Saccharibacteria bacterium]|nr:MAG: transcriptional regulator NrdR [Candidatus Saccharibacteria bacterium]